MIKIIGIIIVLFGTTSLGIYKAGQYLSRLNNLYEIKKAFLYIQSEIRYLSTPLPEIFEGVAKKMRGPIRHFFERVANELKEKNGRELKQIWQESFAQTIKSEYLEKEAREEFLDAGGQLGCLERQAQEKSIEYFLKKWEFLIERRREEKNNRLKLYYVCGVMSGILMVILLV